MLDYLDIIKMVCKIYKENSIYQVPIDCFSLLENYGFRIRTYEDLEKVNPELRVLCGCASDDAFTDGFNRIIAYNSKTNPGRIRFSLMHELSHHVLGHKEKTWNNEKEADILANHILAPRPLIEHYHCESIEDIHNKFGISYAAASHAWRDYDKWMHRPLYSEDWEIVKHIIVHQYPSMSVSYN